MGKNSGVRLVLHQSFPEVWDRVQLADLLCDLFGDRAPHALPAARCVLQDFGTVGAELSFGLLGRDLSCLCGTTLFAIVMHMRGPLVCKSRN